MPLLALPVLGTFGLMYGLVLKNWGRSSPAAWVAYVQMAMALGTIAALDPSEPSDRLYGYLVAYAVSAYMLAVSTLLLSRAGRGARSTGYKARSFRPRPNFVALLALSLVVVVGYYTSVGYSAFVAGVRAQLAGVEERISGLRYQSYGGTTYFFPGYVSQFRNALLPTLILLLIASWRQRGLLRRRRLVAVMWVAVAAFSLMGTGQRGSFVLFMAIALTYYLRQGKVRLSGRSFAVCAAALAALVFSTLALGRRASTGVGLGDRLGEAFAQLVERFTTTNQESAVVGFRYIRQYRSVQDGQGWVDAFFGLLPGSSFRGGDIQNEIFAYRYGSRNGSSPLAIWGDIYYNFGWVGVAVAPILLGIVVAGLTVRMRERPPTNAAALLGAAGVSVVIGFWAAGSPVFLLNNGIVVYVLLWWRGSRLIVDGRPVATGWAAPAVATWRFRPRSPIGVR